jgi:hypothetical protein
MRILNVDKIEYFIIETDDKEWNTYRRSVNLSPDCWERLMGESWESYYTDELEALFQEWIRLKKAYDRS